MTELVFSPQPFAPRPHHFETPQSYLTRLCKANIIDRALIHAAATQRARATGQRHQIALIIAELGGPAPAHFARSYVRATGKLPETGQKLLAATFRPRKNGAARYACARCTAGQPVATFDHRRLSLCLKHGRYLPIGHDHRQQLQIPDDPTWIAAERRYRRAAASAFLTPDLIDTVWQAVRDQATALGPRSWAGALHAAQDQPGFTEGVHDRLALHPATSKILHLAAQPRLWNTVDTAGRNPEYLRAYLRNRLDWIDGEDWVLVEALCLELTRSRKNRLHQIQDLVFCQLPPEPFDDWPG